MMTRDKKLNNSFSTMMKDYLLMIFFPLICTTSTDKRRLLLKNGGHDFEVTEHITNQISSMNDISTNFKLGESLKVARTKIEEDSVGKVTETCEIVSPNNELSVLLSILVWI